MNVKQQTYMYIQTPGPANQFIFQDNVYVTVCAKLSEADDVQNACSLMAAPVAERLRALLLNHSLSGVGSSPALATCETSQVLLAGVPGVFLGILPFSPHLLIGPSHMS